MQYQVIEIQHSDRFEDKYFIRGIYDNFKDASLKANELYKEYMSSNDYWTEDNYDTISPIENIHFIESESGAGVSKDQTYKVVEIEFENNSPCHIDITS